MNESQEGASRDAGSAPIERFVDGVRLRLKLRSLLSIGVNAIAIGAGLLAVLVGARVVVGYAGEAWWYAAVAGIAAAVTFVWWLLTMPRRDSSAQWADQEWRLQDALVSWLHFKSQGKEDGFYALQAKQTADRVSPLRVDQIEVRPNRQRWVTALVLVAVATGLGFMKPSEAVRLRIAQQEQMLMETERINEDLQQQIEELAEGLEDDERELVDPDKLREIAENFEQTEDQKQALRQYAKLEQQLQKQMSRLKQQQDEQTAKRAAEELAKSAETRKLAKPLKQKEYRQTAEELEKLAPKATTKLSEQQKQTARLRAASRRMVAAAKSRRDANASSGSGQQGSGASGASGASSAGSGQAGQGAGGGGSGAGDGELADAMLDLDAAVADLEDALNEAAEQQRTKGECDSQCKSRCEGCNNKVDASLARLSRCLSKMSIKRDIERRLASLCKSCSQCQSSLCSAAAMCQSPNAGQGSGIGSSTTESRRESLAEALAPGPREQLSGIKSQGPSQKTVEAADDGSGVSGRAAVERERTFRRSVESFVSREDIPAGVRLGVKRYFESIHQNEPLATGDAAE